jgi:hypothetical protein
VLILVINNEIYEIVVKASARDKLKASQVSIKEESNEIFLIVRVNEIVAENTLDHELFVSRVEHFLIGIAYNMLKLVANVIQA